jgi:hypothetical protein
MELVSHAWITLVSQFVSLYVVFQLKLDNFVVIQRIQSNLTSAIYI